MRRTPGLPYPTCTAPIQRPQDRRGFTVIELIVCLGVVAVLCGILLPSLRTAREASQRVGCASNMHQVGVALATWANIHDNRIPASANVNGPVTRGQELMAARIATGGAAGPSGWDGLGLLVQGDFLGNCQCLYCASHHGEHTFERYANDYADLSSSKQIYTNYQYSSHLQYQLPPDDPHHGAPITLDAGRAVLLLTDGLRTRSDFNHESGLNRMFADLSIEWWSDTANRLRDSLPETALSIDPAGQDRYSRIWEFLNEPNSTLGP